MDIPHTPASIGDPSLSRLARRPLVAAMLILLAILASLATVDAILGRLLPELGHTARDTAAALLTSALAAAAGYRSLRRFLTEHERLSREIRERRRTEDQLLTLFELAQDMLSISASAPHFIRVNPAFVETLGHDPAVLLSAPYIDFVHPEDRADTIAILGRLNAGERVVDFVNRYRHADGSYRWLQWRATHSAKHGLNFAVARDITAERQHEQALVESEQRYRLLFEHMSDGVTVYEPIDDGNDFRVRDCNRAGERIHRIGRDRLLGRPVTEVNPSVEAFGLLEVLRRVSASGTPEQHPLRQHQGDRLLLWVENFVFRLPGGDLVVVSRDITDRKEAEERLRASELRFRTLFEHAPIGIDLASPDGRLLIVNRTLQQMLGYSEDEMRGQYFNRWTHPDDVLPSAELVQRLHQGEVGRLSLDKRYIRKDGVVIWAHTSVAVVRNPQGEVDFFIAMMEETTERHRAQQEMHSLMEQNRLLAHRLLQVQEQERELVARELHDEIGQSLTGIRADARAILARCAGGGGNDAIRDSAEAIDQVAGRLYSAAYGLIHQLRPTLLDDMGLRASLEQSLEHWTRRHPEIKCTTDIQDDLAELPKDIELAIYRTLQESMTNVLKHADAREVRIHLATEPDDARGAEKIVLQVVDDGRGYDPAERPHGMGLVGMRERVLSLGGIFSVRTSPGHGVDLRVEIPLSTAATPG